jgi:hypothetical protein
VLCAKDAVDGPFAVINADDFYGRDAFEKAASFLTKSSGTDTYSIIGYPLVDTLSEHGTVNRGICTLDTNGNLAGITERINISLQDGKVVCDDGLSPLELGLQTSVSMNFWCFDPSFFAKTQLKFKTFLANFGKELKSEFFIPLVADEFIKEGGKIAVIPTTANWFGVTYKEDAPFVEKTLNEMIAKGEYPTSLWN